MFGKNMYCIDCRLLAIGYYIVRIVGYCIVRIIVELNYCIVRIIELN